VMKIDREDYDAISKWISKANNFGGDEMDCEGNVYWYVLRDNRKVRVLALFTEERVEYVADNALFATWKEECGYTI